jgi:glutamate-1-semialdehyde 2,1-aminomutase
MDHSNKNKKSLDAFAKSIECIPGGVNSPVRAFGGTNLDPLFIQRASGSKIWDIDGQEYIDYVGSWGPMIVGHAHPKVLKAVKDAAEKGTSFGAPTLAETVLARKIIDAFDSVEKVRLVSSGTEAVMTAIRLARAYTKSEFIIKMSGCYHGHTDSLLVSAGSGLAESGTASSSGVPEALAKMTVVIPYNDIQAAKLAFEKYRGQIAAVLIEPIAANMGVVAPLEGYLRELRGLCTKHKSMLIFDEVITGFRVARGGAQELFDVQADITCLGKVIGGGLPLAAFGGKAEIMDMLAPLGPVYQAGTLSGNPIATAAANATLDILTAGNCYKKLDDTAAGLEAGLKKAAAQASIPVTINRTGSVMSCFFTDKKVKNFEDVKSTDIKLFKKYFTSMLNHGIYLAPSAFEAMFVYLAHTKEDIERTIEAARQSFQEIKD